MARREKIILVAAVMVILMGVFFRTPMHAADFENREITISIPGISGTYRLAVVNDLHIVVYGDSVKEYETEVAQRRQMFVDEKQGRYSEKNWELMVEQLNRVKPDGVLLAGDMVDFYSPENLECLKNGTDHLDSPFLYVRADHDYGTWYVDTNQEEVAEKEEEISDNQGIQMMEYPEFLVVGINNSTSQIKKSGLKRLKQIWKMNKPVLLVTHVPLDSLIDDSLAEESRRLWGDRVLLWGEGCYYKPKEFTQKFLDMVLDKDSPVAAVISGHLHFPYEVALNEQINEYVLDASFKGKMTTLLITGEQ